MILKDGEIIENSHIGVFYLGMSKKQIFSLLDLNYETKRQKNEVRIGNIAFWFNSREEVFQIGVTKGFQGKFRGTIGIGSTLEDVKNMLVILFMNTMFMNRRIYQVFVLN